MTIHKIIFLPDPRLRQETEVVTVFDEALHKLIDDMFETMDDARGAGLAAPQIGISKKIAVIDASPDKSQRLVCINPEIIHREGEVVYEEGCLSVPGSYNKVVRAEKVVMRAQDKFGEVYEMEGTGLLGEAMQHEIDHLNGVLYIDLLSPMKRSRARKRLEKFKRMQGN